jgi:hypothetical protein
MSGDRWARVSFWPPFKDGRVNSPKRLVVDAICSILTYRDTIPPAEAADAEGCGATLFGDSPSRIALTSRKTSRAGA